MASKKTKLIFTPFQGAIQSLQRSLKQPKDEFTRDAVIQRFEYTFELSWKMLKRYLEMAGGVKEFNIKNIFREAGKQGLINDVEDWFAYLEARNLTSHTYNEDVAEETYQTAKKFAPDAAQLLKNLEKLCAD